jgi:hypothetical protein
MQHVHKVLALAAVGGFVLAQAVYAQDQSSSPQSLGDLARQARQQKQQKDAPPDKDVQTQPKDPVAQGAQSKTPDTQSKDGQQKDGQDQSANAQASKPGKRVITNDEIPEHIGPTSTTPNGYRQQPVNYPQPAYPNSQVADQIKNQVLSMKSYIANTQAQIANLEQSIRYTGGGCVTGCVQWNERQRQKQDQIEAMKQQLEQQQKQLEHMQEMARRQGFGSSVYDP